MFEKLKDGLGRLKDRWQSQSRIKKISLSLALISVFVVIGIVYYMNTRIQYGVLFTDLSDADAGTVTKELKSENVPYKLTDDGKTIMIDQSKVDQTRIDLAVDNKLPNSSTGFELFDNTNVMTTDEDRKVMYQRAVTGELERAIESLNEVEKAKVMLVTPKQSVFDDDGKEKKAKASVVLTLKGNGITDSAVQGIVALTSGAVENLSPQNVKVVDSNGQVLSGGSSEDTQMSSYSTKYMGIKKAYEKMLEEKINKLLQPIYGVNKLRVSVNLDLNFDSIERKMVTYNNPKIRSENVQTTGDGQGNQQNTQTGEANNNASNVTGNSSSNNNGSYSRSVNNELDTQTTKVISAPGSIRRMTSSVVVNGDLSQNDQNQIKTLVSSAVGFDQNRGDAINVQGIDFVRRRKSTDDNTKAKKKKSNTWLYVGIGAGVLILLGAIIATILLIRRRRRNAEDEYYEDEADVTQPAAVQTEEDAEEQQAETTAEEKEAQANAAKREKAQKDKDQKAKEYADKHPEEVADLLKAWMKEK